MSNYLIPIITGLLFLLLVIYVNFNHIKNSSTSPTKTVKTSISIAKPTTKIYKKEVVNKIPPQNTGLIKLTMSVVKYYRYDKPYILLVDYTKPLTVPRLYVYRLKDYKCVFQTEVSQGYSPPFSNKTESRQSSIGVYKTGALYEGKHGTSRLLYGLDLGHNDKVFKRQIVIHSAPYIGNGKSGHSWGCLAVPLEAIKTILDYTQPNTLIIGYYPSNLWLKYEK